MADLLTQAFEAANRSSLLPYVGNYGANLARIKKDGLVKKTMSFKIDGVW